MQINVILVILLCFIRLPSYPKNVTGFHSTMQKIQNDKVAKIAVVYDRLILLRTYILIFYQMLYILSMDRNLLCVDQLRDHGIIVNNVPLIRSKAHEWNKNSHSIIFQDNDLRIVLQFEKPISNFQTRAPTV